MAICMVAFRRVSRVSKTRCDVKMEKEAFETEGGRSVYGVAL